MQRHRGQGGLSLIEIMVSLVLASIVVIAATAVFATANLSRGSQDADAQLQDTGRFVLAVVTRSLQMVGYQDYLYDPGATNTSATPFGRLLREVQNPAGSTSGGTGTNAPLFDPTRTGGVADISGADAATASGSGSSVNFAATTGVVNQSDTLFVRFQGSSTPRNSGTADFTVVDCLGNGIPTPQSDQDFAINNFAVRLVSATAEPELACTRRNTSSGQWDTQPIAIGVEVFHVAYGADPNNVGMPTRWVTASTVPSLTNGWKSVRAVRFGFVVRGPVGSGVPGTQTFSPVGAGLGTFTAPNDGRLRRMYSSTVYIRNELLP